MIVVRDAQDERSRWESLAAKLTAKARKLAEARSETRRREARGDASRWRRAELLWPLLGRNE